MGKYLQLGIVHHILIDKDKADQVGLSVEQLRDKLNEDLDMSLFDYHVNRNKISFVIKEAVVLEQLQTFMKLQFSLYDQRANDGETFDAALHAISQLSTLNEHIELAEEKEFQCFQNSRIDESIRVSPWESLPYKISVFTFFVEGKIVMEQYCSLLKYIESIVKASSKLSIRGAFRASID